MFVLKVYFDLLVIRKLKLWAKSVLKESVQLPLKLGKLLFLKKPKNAVSYTKVATVIKLKLSNQSTGMSARIFA